MKNLKKILVALVIIAMTVASVATIAIANAEEYTGTVEAAQQLLDKVASAEKSDSVTLIDAKTDALSAVSEYFKLTPIDPTSEGYDALVAEYNAWVAKVLLAYSFDINAASDYKSKIQSISALYADVAVIKPVGEGFTVSSEYVCSECGTKYSLTTLAYILAADYTCANCEGGGNVVPVSEKAITLDEFIAKTDLIALEVSTELVNSFYDTSIFFEDSITYADLLAVNTALVEVRARLDKLEALVDEALPENTSVYTGKLAEAEAMLNLLNANLSYDELKSGLANVYAYLVEKPVDPTSDAYLAFIRKYNDLADALVTKFAEKLGETEVFNDRLAAFKDMYDCLVKTPISENVVSYYNSLLSEFRAEYAEYEEIVGMLIACPDYVDPTANDVADPSKIIASIDLALQNPEIAKVYLEKVIYPYIRDHSINPAAERYEEMIEKYAQLADAILAPYINALKNSATYAERLEALKALRAYLLEYCVSGEAVALYNNERNKLKAEMVLYFTEIYNKEILPSYKVPVVNSQAKEKTLNSLLSKIENANNAYSKAADETDAAKSVLLDKITLKDAAQSAYDAALAEYNNAEEADKDAKKAVLDAADEALKAAVAACDEANTKYSAAVLAEDALLEAVKPAVAELVVYITGSGLDSKASYYKSFKNNYTNQRNTLVNALMRKVDNQLDADAKKAALKEVKAYLEAAPLTHNAIVKYNAKVHEVYGEEADVSAELLGSVYYEIAKAYSEDFLTYEDKLTLLKETLSGAVAEKENWEAEYERLAKQDETLRAQLQELDASIAEKTAQLEGETDEDAKLLLEQAIEALQNERETVAAEHLTCIAALPDAKASLDAQNKLISDTTLAIAKAHEDYLATIKKLAGYFNSGSLDITDPEYDSYLTMLGEVDAAVANFIAKQIDTTFENDDMATAVQNISVYMQLVKETNLELSIKKYIETVKEKSKSIEEIYNALTKNFDSSKEIVTISSLLDSYVKDYANLLTFEERVEAIINIYDTYLVAAKSLEKIYANNANLIAECEAIFDAFELEFTEWVNTASEFEEKLERLLVSFILLNSAPLSQAMIDDCNELLAEMQLYDFKGMNQKLDETVKVITYAAPEGFESDVEDVVSADIYAAYEILACGKKPVDFASASFIDVISFYNMKKDAKKSEYESGFASAEDKIAFLGEMYSDLKNYPTSVSFNDLYAKLTLSAFKTYEEAVDEVAVKFENNLQFVHNLLDAVSFDENTFKNDKANALVFNNMQTKLNALEYEIAAVYTSKYENATGTADEINATKTSIYNKVKVFTALYNFDEYFAPANLADVLAKELFNDYLDAFEKSIEGKSEKAQATEISILALILENSNAPKLLAEIFNARFPEVKINEYVADKLEAGKTADLIAIAQNYYSASGIAAKEDCIKSLIVFLNTYQLDKTPCYTAFSEAYEVIVSNAEAITEKLKEALDMNAPIADYSLPVIADVDHEKNDLFIKSFTNPVGGESSTIKTEPNGNKYNEITLPKWQPYAVIDTSKVDVASGYVFEFEIMTQDVLSFQLRIIHANNGLTTHTTVFQIVNNKIPYKFTTYDGYKDNDAEFENYKSDVNPQISLNPGEWMHVVVAIDVQSNEYEVCVNYQSLGKKQIYPAGNEISTFTSLRINASNASGPVQTFGLDNIKIYNGTAYRILDKFDGMSDADKFSYFVSVLNNEELEAINRVNAYTEASYLVGSNGLDQDDLTTFKNFDIESVAAQCRVETMAKLEAIAAPLMDKVVDSTNTGEVTGLIEMIRGFITKNATTIDQASDKFTAINEKLQAMEKEVKRVENLIKYVEALQKLHRAPTLSALNRHYADVLNYYRLCELDNSEKLEKAAKDPVVTAFVDAVKEDIDVIKKLDGAEVTLKNYQEIYITARITERLYYENSEKFIDCVKAIELLVPNKDELSAEEYANALKEAIQKNPDYVNSYMVVLNAILTSGEYNEEFEGFAVAKEVYDFANKEFYTVLQNQYYAVIAENFERYAKTNSYIEKAGICAYVENYIKENSVDTTTELGAKYLSILKMCQDELEVYRADYATILNANTNQFIGIVEEMSAYTTYKELKPLYDDAIANYYYNMNVDSEEAKAAIAKFAIYEDMIEEWELNGKLLVDYAEALADAKRTTHKYRALVNCAKYIDKVDSGVEGVADALKLYEEKLNEYNEQINPINEEISKTVDTVCAVRVNSVAAAVLAVIKTIFSK